MADRGRTAGRVPHVHLLASRETEAQAQWNLMMTARQMGPSSRVCKRNPGFRWRPRLIRSAEVSWFDSRQCVDELVALLANDILKQIVWGKTVIGEANMATAGTAWLHRMGTRAIDLLFPPSCVACGVEMGELVDDVAMCTTCRDALPRIAWATCQRCAARVPEIPGCVSDCKHCRGHKIQFDRTFALGAYDGLFRDLVLEMKNDATGRLANAFGEFIALQFAETIREHRARRDRADSDARLAKIVSPRESARFAGRDDRSTTGSAGRAESAPLAARHVCSVGSLATRPLPQHAGGDAHCAPATGWTHRGCCWSTIFSRPAPPAAKRPAC